MVTRSIRLAACFALALPAKSCQAEPRIEPEQPPIDRLFPFHEGGKGGKWGFINRRGEVVVPPRFIHAAEFSEGLGRVRTDEGLGYIDAQGKTVFTLPGDLRVDWTRPFSDGLAAFSVRDKWGYFDRHGKVVVEPRYDDIGDFSEGLAAVNEGAKADRHLLIPSAKFGGKWGFIDRTGKLVIPLRYDRVAGNGFSDGLAGVENDGKWGFIDRTGNEIISPQSLAKATGRGVIWAGGFSEGLARVFTIAEGDPPDFRVGFIDKTGKLVFEHRLGDAEDFSEGLAMIRTVGNSGYLDRTGRVVIEPQFTRARAFSEGLAAVQRGEGWCYIDKQGKAVITGRFNDAKDFKGGLARVHEGGWLPKAFHGPAEWREGEWYYINPKGEKVRRYCRDDDITR
jgi:hypothetical protein